MKGSERKGKQEGIHLTGDKGDWDKEIRKWEWMHEWWREKWQNRARAEACTHTSPHYNNGTYFSLFSGISFFTLKEQQKSKTLPQTHNKHTYN